MNSTSEATSSSVELQIHELLARARGIEEVRPAEALAVAEVACRLAREHGHVEGLANSHRSMGAVYRLQGNYLQALDHLEQARTLYEKLHDEMQLAAVHGYIGAIEQSRGEYGAALRHFGTALRIFERLEHHSSIASTYANIGNIHYGMGHYDLAAQQYQKALRIYEREKNAGGIAIAYVHIAGVYLKRREFERALHFAEHALHLFQQLDQPRNQALTHATLATIYRESGQVSHARAEALQALRISEDKGFEPVKGRALIELGQLHLHERELEQAERNLQAALRIAAAIDNRYLKIDGYQALEALAEARNDSALADLYRQELQNLAAYL